MARHAHEFQCDHNCGYYNYPPLDDTMTGNYTIICGNPACKHQHYRVIVKGVVTADRHSDKWGEAHVIHVLPSQSQKEKRKLGSIAQIRQMEAAGLMTTGGRDDG